MQGTQVWSPRSGEDPTSRGTTKSVCHNYWSTCALEPRRHSKRSPGIEKPTHCNGDPAHGKKKGEGGRGGWVCFPLKIRNYKKWWGRPTTARGGAVRPLPGPPQLTCAQAHRPPSLSSPGATTSCVSSEHFSPEETRLARSVFSQLPFCCQHCQRILDQKKKKKQPTFPLWGQASHSQDLCSQVRAFSEAGFTQSDGRRKMAFVMSICCFVKNVVKDINKSDITSCSNVKQLS